MIDKHYESLSKLYLRLKGYVASNLILHSEDKGNLKTELDIIAFRFPYHSQENRKVNFPDYLCCSDSRIEILLADVKNTKRLESVRFNQGLRNDKASIKNLIEWIGTYKTVDDLVINKFERHFNLHNDRNLNSYSEFDEDFDIGKFRFRFVLFCPSLPEWKGNGYKYIHGQEIIDFIWDCLNNKALP